MKLETKVTKGKERKERHPYPCPSSFLFHHYISKANKGTNEVEGKCVYENAAACIKIKNKK
jgi:hypothetical protein